MKPIFEVCVDSAEAAMAAEQGGANRVEMCSDLLEGGLTPSHGTLRVARRRLGIKIMAMVRPRGGDFCYSDVEFDVMREDLRAAKDLGADGIVLGLLRPDGTVDRERTAELMALARPLPVTFHRAFDMTRDPFEALETLIALGVDRVLTSGQEPSVVEGLELIAELVRRAEGRIIVMPGGGITDRNVARVVAESGVTEVHFATLEPREGRMVYRNPRVFMGGTLRPPEYSQEVTRPESVAQVIGASSGTTAIPK
jgi:copper homeostasis protein